MALLFPPSNLPYGMHAPCQLNDLSDTTCRTSAAAAHWHRTRKAAHWTSTQASHAWHVNTAQQLRHLVSSPVFPRRWGHSRKDRHIPTQRSTPTPTRLPHQAAAALPLQQRQCSAPRCPDNTSHTLSLTMHQHWGAKPCHHRGAGGVMHPRCTRKQAQAKPPLPQGCGTNISTLPAYQPPALR